MVTRKNRDYSPMAPYPQNFEAIAEALQKTIDMMNEIGELDQFVPRVLDLVAEATGSKSCAFFENSRDETIWLRYWHFEGMSYLPGDLVKLDPQKFGLVRNLAEGFRSPDDYLGIPTLTVGTVQIDHVNGTSVPEFDQFAVATGCELELNVGVGAGGVRDMTLCLYRGKESPFTQGEIAFAESIVKHIRIAWTIVKAAENARFASLALEREGRAKARTAAIEEINRIIRQCVDRMANAKHPREAIMETLGVIAREVHELGALDVGLMECNHPTNTIKCTALFRGGLWTDVSDSPLGREFSLNQPELVGPWEKIQSEKFVWGLTSDEAVLIPEVRAYHESFGAKSVAYVPLRCGNTMGGFIGFSLSREDPPSKEIVGLLRILADQVALALELERVGAIAKQVEESRLNEFIALERVEATRRRAAEHERASRAQQAVIDALPKIQNFDELASTVLGIVSKAFGATSSAYFEHLEGEPIRLCYWYRNGEIIEPLNGREWPPEISEVYRELKQGFTVPDEHLGSSWRDRTDPVVLDHGAGTAIERFDRFCCGLGCDVELNIPLVVAGRADGAFLIFRPSGSTFSPDEISLAESLANQLAMGIQVSRLVEQARDFEVARLNEVVAREREESALARLKMVEETNRAIRREIEERSRAERIVRGHANLISEVLNRISREPSPEEHLAGILESLVRTLEIDSAAVFRYDPHTNRTIYELDYRAGTSVSELEKHQRRVKTSLSSSWDDYHLDALKAGRILLHDEHELREHPSFAPYRNGLYARGIREVLSAPMFSGTGFLGFFALRSHQPGFFAGLDQLFIEAMASQASLAIQMLLLHRRGEHAAVMEERNRIARDLHDSLAQGFTGVIINLEAASSALDSDRPDIASTHVEAANLAARSGLEEARRSVLALRHSPTWGAKYEDALLECIRALTKATAIQVEVRAVGRAYPIPGVIGDGILRIVQEAVTNVIRHASAKNIDLNVVYTADLFMVSIGDDGLGFDLNTTPPGLGIRGMVERGRAFGCDVLITSTVGTGTRIDLRCPRPTDIPGDHS